jgi:catechol 2,3-dioxygenase-like lactoylglutathione lyase family enzyme
MSNAGRLGLSAIGQIAVVVHDVDRAEAFYRDALGLRFLFRAGDLVFFDCGGVRLMLSRAESAEFDHPSSVLYFEVTDIEGAHFELSGRGVPFRDAPHVVADLGDRVLWLTFFDDPEGNVLALMEEKVK